MVFSRLARLPSLLPYLLLLFVFVFLFPIPDVHNARVSFNVKKSLNGPGAHSAALSVLLPWRQCATPTQWCTWSVHHPQRYAAADDSGGVVPYTTPPPPRFSFLNLFQYYAASKDSGETTLIQVLNDGFFAAVKSPTATAVSIISPSSSDIALEEVLRANPSVTGVVGPFGDEALEQVLTYATASDASLTSIGPYVAASSFSNWTPNAYFTRSPPKAEIYAMITHLVTFLHPKRVGLMQLTGSLISEKNAGIITQALYKVHNIIPMEYKQSVDDSSLDMEAFNAFLEKGPQVVIVNAGSSPVVSAFVEQFSTNPVAMDIPLYFTSGGYSTMYQLIEKGARHDYYFTSPNVMPTETEFNYIQVFESDMKNLIATNMASSFKTYDELASSILGGVAVSGWLIGQVLLQAVQQATTVTSAEAFQSSLFDQRQYSISGDNLIGPFGGQCSSLNVQRGVSCECNQGGHVVNMYHSLTGSMAPTWESVFTFPRNDCGAQNYTLPFYNLALVVFDDDNEAMKYMATQLENGMQPALEIQDRQDEVMLPFSVRIATRESIVSYVQDNIIDFIVGPLPNTRNALTQIPNVLVVDPVDTYPLPQITNSMVVYLMPTMDQQIYIFAEVAKMNGYTCAVVLRRSPEYDAICTIIHNAASQYSINIQIYDVEEGEDIVDSSAALRQDFVMLIGLQSSDVPPVQDYLEKRASTYFTLLYNDFSLFYDDIIEAFTSDRATTTDVGKRLLTQTNLPTWTDFSGETSSANAVLLKAYHEFFSNFSSTSPASLQAWYTADKIQRLLTNTNSIEESVLASTVHVPISAAKEGERNISDWPSALLEDASVKTTNKNPVGIQNAMATDITVISLAHVVNPSVPISYGPFSPNLTVNRGSSFDLNILLAVSIPIAAVVLVLTALMVYFCLCRMGNRASPPNPNRPVTLLVCDIYRSSGLWASHPREMLKATEAYQSIVRKQIRKYQCYEVKTVVDSFLIASDDPVNIVNLAVAVQRALYEHDWGTILLDVFYTDQEKSSSSKTIHNHRSASTEEKLGADSYNRKKTSWNEDPASGNDAESVFIPSAQVVVSEPYCHMWNGLRVQMGIHTGFCEMSSKDNDKSVDYHGDTVRIAARTEGCAHGGQILMTQTTWDFLQSTDVADYLSKLLVKDAGTRTLRGVPLPVRMYEVEAIDGREWKGLEIVPCDNEFEDDGDGVSMSVIIASESDTLQDGLRNHSASLVHHVVVGLFSPYPVQEKLSALRTIMDHWRVSTSAPSHLDEEQQFHTLAKRLSNRTSKVFALQEHDGANGNPWPTSSTRGWECPAGGGEDGDAVFHMRRRMPQQDYYYDDRETGNGYSAHAGLIPVNVMEEKHIHTNTATSGAAFSPYGCNAGVFQIPQPPSTQLPYQHTPPPPPPPPPSRSLQPTPIGMQNPFASNHGRPSQLSPPAPAQRSHQLHGSNRNGALPPRFQPLPNGDLCVNPLPPTTIPHPMDNPHHHQHQHQHHHHHYHGSHEKLQTVSGVPSSSFTVLQMPNHDEMDIISLELGADIQEEEVPRAWEGHGPSVSSAEEGFVFAPFPTQSLHPTFHANDAATLPAEVGLARSNEEEEVDHPMGSQQSKQRTLVISPPSHIRQHSTASAVAAAASEAHRSPNHQRNNSSNENASSGHTQRWRPPSAVRRRASGSTTHTTAMTRMTTDSVNADGFHDREEVEEEEQYVSQKGDRTQLKPPTAIIEVSTPAYIIANASTLPSAPPLQDLLPEFHTRYQVEDTFAKRGEEGKEVEQDHLHNNNNNNHNNSTHYSVEGHHLQGTQVTNQRKNECPRARYEDTDSTFSESQSQLSQ